VRVEPQEEEPKRLVEEVVVVLVERQEDTHSVAVGTMAVGIAVLVVVHNCRNPAVVVVVVAAADRFPLVVVPERLA